MKTTLILILLAALVGATITTMQYNASLKSWSIKDFDVGYYHTLQSENQNLIKETVEDDKLLNEYLPKCNTANDGSVLIIDSKLPCQANGLILTKPDSLSFTTKAATTSYYYGLTPKY